MRLPLYKTTSMKKENIVFASWLINICKAMRKAKGSYEFMSSEAESHRPLIERTCNIINDAIAKIEDEIEKLD